MFHNTNLQISIFGQSHSPAIGVTLSGIPAGFRIDFDELNRFLQRRAPGQGSHTTSRKEADTPEFLSGLSENGVTCGAPLTAIIRNTDTRSSDYEQLRDIPRPSHADYPAFAKYGTAHDIRGGGAFSGRLTAPLCIAGGICLQLLREKGVSISAGITQIGLVKSKEAAPIPTPSDAMLTAIEAARQDGDSLGGIIECRVEGLPAGVGEPIFGGLENRIAAVVFGIPAVKGIEFGNGFAAAELLGSQNNDEFCITNGKIVTKTNNHGGILGGISTGMPLIFRTAFKPTPSIAKPQTSVSLSRMQEVPLSIKGRHDPCIVPRAVPCVEAAAALAIYN
ncbi:MAG: chorismate synthase [Oscillospiraceae bacterium]|nr:chorismate synthase [Oscillospiraceae bacterium]